MGLDNLKKSIDDGEDIFIRGNVVSEIISLSVLEKTELLLYHNSNGNSIWTNAISNKNSFFLFFLIFISPKRIFLPSKTGEGKVFNFLNIEAVREKLFLTEALLDWKVWGIGNKIKYVHFSPQNREVNSIEKIIFFKKTQVENEELIKSLGERVLFYTNKSIFVRVEDIVYKKMLIEEVEKINAYLKMREICVEYLKKEKGEEAAVNWNKNLTSPSLCPSALLKVNFVNEGNSASIEVLESTILNFINQESETRDWGHDKLWILYLTGNKMWNLKYSGHQIGYKFDIWKLSGLYPRNLGVGESLFFTNYWRDKSFMGKVLSEGSYNFINYIEVKDSVVNILMLYNQVFALPNFVLKEEWCYKIYQSIIDIPRRKVGETSVIKRDEESLEKKIEKLKLYIKESEITLWGKIVLDNIERLESDSKKWFYYKKVSQDMMQQFTKQIINEEAKIREAHQKFSILQEDILIAENLDIKNLLQNVTERIDFFYNILYSFEESLVSTLGEIERNVEKQEYL